MKNKLFRFVPFVPLVLALACITPILVLETGCPTVDQRTTAVTTLKVVGLTADTAMKVAAQAYHNGQIRADQWQSIADFHDQKFLPTYNTAVSAVQADLSSIATPDVIALCQQLGALIQALVPSAKVPTLPTGT
jgi:hypothetical protein